MAGVILPYLTDLTLDSNPVDLNKPANFKDSLKNNFPSLGFYNL